MCSGQRPPPNWKHLKTIRWEPSMYYVFIWRFVKLFRNKINYRRNSPSISDFNNKIVFKTYSKKRKVIIAIKRIRQSKKTFQRIVTQICGNACMINHNVHGKCQHNRELKKTCTKKYVDYNRRYLFLQMQPCWMSLKLLLPNHNISSRSKAGHRDISNVSICCIRFWLGFKVSMALPTALWFVFQWTPVEGVC